MTGILTLGRPPPSQGTLLGLQELGGAGMGLARLTSAPIRAPLPPQLR